jgi:SAM-dependent methyltransferase
MTEPTQEKSNHDTDNWSYFWSAYAESARWNPAQRMRHEFLLGEITSGKESVGLLLDVGSGQGDFIEQAAERNVAQEYLGFELSDTGVNISRAKVPDATFIQVDLFAPSTEVLEFTKCADVVVCSEVIEHVDDPVELCRRIKGFLKLGGRLIVTVPGGPKSAFDIHIGHRVHYDRASIKNVLVSAGFEVGQITSAGFPFFNLYRLIVILMGRRLIGNVGENTFPHSGNKITKIAMFVFGLLFKLNFKDSPFGWQIYAEARRND